MKNDQANQVINEGDKLTQVQIHKDTSENHPNF